VVYVAYTLPDATHNPRQDTYAVAALRARDGTLLWRVPTARLMSPLAVADGVLIVSFGKLVGLRASDGATLWRSSLEAGILALSQGVLYFADATNLSALRLVDGRTLWQTPVPSFPVGTPPVADGTSVYVGAGNGSVVALRAVTGAIRWTAFQSAAASPVVWHYPLATYGGHLYVTASDVQSVLPALLRLSTVDGTYDGDALLLPTYTQLFYPVLTGGIFTTVLFPSVPSGRADAPAPTMNGYRLSATGYGHLLWSVPGQAGAGQTTAHDAQTFYLEAFSPGAVISAYRLTDGAVRWRQPALVSGGTRIGAGAGYLFETLSGTDDPCRNPPIYQATPQIRALTATKGAVAWTRALDALL
jgi:outer membrane protein assembly factor BamB